jgi:hypothetical protein
MVLKTYSVLNDITIGEVDSDILDKDIISSGYVNGYVGFIVDGDSLSVHGDSFSNEVALDALILNHIIPADILTTRYKCLGCAGIFEDKFEMNGHLSANPNHEVEIIYVNLNE